MKFRTFQECRQAEGWQPVRIASGSKDDVAYTVFVNPWGADRENICECLGYTHHGHCRHQAIAADHVCRWYEGGFDIEQTPTQRQGMVCPGCGGLTRWSMEVEE